MPKGMFSDIIQPPLLFTDKFYKSKKCETNGSSISSFQKSVSGSSRSKHSTYVQIYVFKKPPNNFKDEFLNIQFLNFILNLDSKIIFIYNLQKCFKKESFSVHLSIKKSFPLLLKILQKSKMIIKKANVKKNPSPYAITVERDQNGEKETGILLVTIVQTVSVLIEIFFI